MKELMQIQDELKAPKGQINKFGGYKYRSCEDILEAVKPLLKKYNCCLLINDEIVKIGERYYVKATATLVNSEDKFVSATSFAREPESKKGMDASQLTGASSSYSRKYALNGLFAIDDTKDADTMDNTKTDSKKELENLLKKAGKWSDVTKKALQGMNEEQIQEKIKQYS